MSCAICQTRRPRRACPGIHADICAICCGAGREVTVSCPASCEYLQEARKHDPPAAFDATRMGHPDIRVTEEFLESHSTLLLAISLALTHAAAEIGAVDSDVRQALESLIQTYRTLQSGLIYEDLPANPLAANLYQAVQEAFVLYRREETQQLGISKTRDNDLLRVLVFFERLALDRNNGRPRSRAFLDMLRIFEPVSEPAIQPSSLILY